MVRCTTVIIVANISILLNLLSFVGTYKPVNDLYCLRDNNAHWTCKGIPGPLQHKLVHNDERVGLYITLHFNSR